VAQLRVEDEKLDLIGFADIERTEQCVLSITSLKRSGEAACVYFRLLHREPFASRVLHLDLRVYRFRGYRPLHSRIERFPG